jgi:hypothetical protein
VDGDTATQALVEAVNNTERFLVTSSSLPDGATFVRVTVGQGGTAQRHVDELWESLNSIA